MYAGYLSGYGVITLIVVFPSLLMTQIKVMVMTRLECTFFMLISTGM